MPDDKELKILICNMGKKYIQVFCFLTTVFAVNPAWSASTKNWSNSDEAWPPGTNQEWSVGSNWGGTAPVDDDWVRIARWNGAAWTSTVVYLNTPIAAVADIYTYAGNKLYIGSSGIVTSKTAIFFGTAAYSTRGDCHVHVESGGQVMAGASLAVGYNSYMYVAPGAQVLPATTFAVNYTSTVESAGTIVSTTLVVNSDSTMKVLGGTVTVIQPYDAICLGTTGGGVSPGTMLQVSGTVSTVELQLRPGGVYEISGGSLTGTGAQGFYFRWADAPSGGTGGTFRVVGSGATNILFNGLRYLTGFDRTNATYAFVPDNSSNHISRIIITTNGTSGATLRDGVTLNVSPMGGVLLSGTNVFTLIERPSGSADTGWRVGPGALWTDSKVDAGTTNLIQITLNNGVNQGLLHRDGAIAFPATATGYVDLSRISTEEPMKLQLRVTGGTLSAFTGALTAAGITWKPGIGDYDVLLLLNPAVSGSKYFAWDLSGIDPAMMISGLEERTSPRGMVIAIK